MSKFWTAVKTVLITILTLALFLTTYGCGKKNESKTTQKIEIKQSNNNELIVDPLMEDQLICHKENCPQGVVRLYNFNSSKKHKTCVGAHIGEGKILTTASCIEKVDDLVTTCENIYVKFNGVEKPFKCQEFIEIGVPSSNINYQRKSDFAIFQLKMDEDVSSIEITNQAIISANYQVWTIYDKHTTDAVMVSKKCNIDVPNSTNEQLNNLNNEISYNVQCDTNHRLPEGSIILNRFGQIIALYSRNPLNLNANIISLACIKTKSLVGFDGKNCPNFEENQISENQLQILNLFDTKKSTVYAQNNFTALFKWQTLNYLNFKLYQPECILDYHQAKKYLNGTIFGNRYINFKFENYLLTINSQNAPFKLELEPIKMNAEIDLKYFKQHKKIKFTYFEDFKSEDINLFLQGKSPIRNTIHLKLCE